MQSLLGLASKLPSRGLLTRFVRFQSSPLVPRFISVANARRPIHTTFSVSFPPKAAASAKKPSTKTRGRTAVKKAKPKTVTKAKKKPVKAIAARKKKPAVAAKKKPKKKKVVKPKPLKVTRAMGPPMRYPGPYILYYNQRLRDLGSDKPVTMESTRALTRECGAAWRNLTPAEQQPYVDESLTHKAEYYKRREEYFKNVDPAVFRALNKKQRLKGNNGYRKPPSAPEDRRPVTTFFRFLAEFRQTEEAKGLSVLETSSKAAAQWKTLPESTKAAYHDAYLKDVERYKARH